MATLQNNDTFVCITYLYTQLHSYWLTTGSDGGWQIT